VWTDPSNADPSFARNRVRATVLPTLERELGPGVAEALVRTAGQLRADADLLDELAESAYADAQAAGGGLDVGVLAGLPEALRGRVLHRAARAAGVPGSACPRCTSRPCPGSSPAGRGRGRWTSPAAWRPPGVVRLCTSNPEPAPWSSA
jgi:hypothetical protein